jgi:uncharacterized protein YkwD
MTKMKAGALRQARLLACALLLLPAGTGTGGTAGTAGAAKTGDLAALRGHALEIVNAARREQGREPLKFSDTLSRAAQAHAEDMLARGYYAHLSPEGEDARDRYVAAGGDRWELVAENIASCSPCAEVPAEAHVEQFQRRWMESPHHRANILGTGLATFGFGIVAGDEGPILAVQTFAGPGTPHGRSPVASPGPDAAPLGAGAAGEAFARALNARREERSRPPLEASERLSAEAAGLLPGPGEEVTLRGASAGDIEGDWATVSTLAGSCGGCGAQVTASDIDDFLGMWLANPVYESRLLAQGLTSVGFALRAFGDGRKVAIAVLGERR